MTDDERSIQDDLVDAGEQRRITWFKSKLTGEYYFRIQGDNFKTIAASEGYMHKEDMFDTIDEYFGEWEVVEGEP